MNLKDIIAKLPEAERPDAEKAIQDAIVAANPVAGIDSNEKAAAFIKTNSFFKGAFDSEISKSHEAHDAKFVKEKLPGLVEAKIRELNPPTDPRDIKLAEFEAKLAERDRKEMQAKQEAIALKIAATEGIPVDDVERFLADDDMKTTETVKAYAARMKAWRDAGIESALKERYGNNGQPKGSQPPTGKTMAMKDFEALSPKDQALKMNEGYSLIER